MKFTKNGASMTSIVPPGVDKDYTIDGVLLDNMNGSWRLVVDD